ncbi:hypothetical protein TBLA_0H00130 [Henningerozyma blattae CBS 6284]|uniref:Alpha-1,3-mannosyltransferase n=1 Tax=Henningerozyma blattae (strain ATCC 34711 / CBS 6284 / DSM 70876 / NBRC 10599 / NRRL Y-10934 / UCD 77-7) TaxID=1071380 RepID=I2H7F4_HENB6|nr:hypothetical protein TBLA_0H00130 [Tetrapisispora blattae CBS 6284]CCH62306.1 hypothetical protein TBLA_0H00130 [Tetrapisispora blattae CBS 6284]
MPSAFRSGSINLGLSHSLDDIDIRPLDDIPFSPLDIIPDFDSMAKLQQKASWNPFSKLANPQFHELSLQDRCNFYFRQLYNMNEDWSNDYHIILFDIADIQIDSKEEKSGSILGDEELLRIHRKKNDVKLALQRLRIYDRCFIQNDDISIKGIFEDTVKSEVANSLNKRNAMKNIFTNYDQWDFEHRMFPFLRFFNNRNIHEMFPKIRYGTEMLDRWTIPILTDKTRLHAKFSNYEFDRDQSFWVNWNRMSKNVARRGIIMSFTDKEVDWAIRLLVSLRYQGNTLPIQIIYTDGDLTDENIQRLIFAAQNGNVRVPYKNGAPRPGQLTVQEIMFLDVTKMLDSNFVEDFKFKGKWLASFFNLFEEHIFLDADTVPYVDLNYFFNTQEYNQTGTLFFRDRIFKGKMSGQCNALFESIHPLLPENKYFDNKRFIDEDYVENECEQFLNQNERIYKRFFKDGKADQMDSGLYVIDRTSHIIPLIMGATLHMLRVSGCIYGDKEFFWLGFLASGHSFAFDSMAPAAYGDLDRRSKPSPEDYVEICSTQLAHLNSDLHMLWTNGGSNNCKMGDDIAKKDWENPKIKWPKTKFKTEHEMKEWYEDAIDSKYAVIAEDNDQGWGKKTLACSNSNWCARYEVKFREFSYNELALRGTLVEFTDDEFKHLRNINEIWSYLDMKIIEKAPLTGKKHD